MKKIKDAYLQSPFKTFLLITSLLLFIYFGSSIYLSFNLLLFSKIETFLRIVIILIVFFVTFLIIYKYYQSLLKSKKKTKIIVIIITLLIIIQLISAFAINKIYRSLGNINKNQITYTTNLITLTNNDINNINDVKNKKLAIINDKHNIEGYIISQEIINRYKLDQNNEIIQYESFIQMLNDLYDQTVDAIFVSGNYITMFSAIESFEEIKLDTKIIVSQSKKENKTKEKTKEKVLTEPFTILIMGVDSTKEDINSGSAFNGDALILITFNPKTLNTTILSIPRDTYVPIMCFKNKTENKITHAAWHGENCMIKTIENFTNIKIDYYVKINFKGVVDLVNALGGIQMDVPITFCEQNSKREWGNKTIYLKAGWQTINGEEALALARHREDLKICGKYYVNNNMNDLKRGLNQQLVLGAILNEVKNINSINKIYNLLNIIEKSIDTNLKTNQILNFYNIGKDIIKHNKKIKNDDILLLERLYLNGYDQYIYDPSFGKSLYNYNYYQESLNEVIIAMKINLELEEPLLIKTFSFSINEPYQQQIIGKDISGKKRIQVVPNFTVRSRQEAIDWGINNNIKIAFDIIDSADNDYLQNQIIKQSVPINTLLSHINANGIILTIINKIQPKTEKINCTLLENENISDCLMPNLINNSISEVDKWLNKIHFNFIVTKIKETTIDPLKNGIIFEQSAEPNCKISDIGAELIIKYYMLEEITNEDPKDEQEKNNPIKD